jgi:hypothetical protein
MPTLNSPQSSHRAEHDRVDLVDGEHVAYQQVGQVGIAVGAGLAVAAHDRGVAWAGPCEQCAAVVGEQGKPATKVGTQPLEAVVDLMAHAGIEWRLRCDRRRRRRGGALGDAVA